MADGLGPCEVCGRPATAVTQDVREDLPSGSREQGWDQRWSLFGPVHRTCGDHYRPSQEERLPIAVLLDHINKGGGFRPLSDAEVQALGLDEGEDD